jgi:NADH-quinone oxidoreductase subunit N
MLYSFINEIILTSGGLFLVYLSAFSRIRESRIPATVFYASILSSIFILSSHGDQVIKILSLVTSLYLGFFIFKSDKKNTSVFAGCLLIFTAAILFVISSSHSILRMYASLELQNIITIFWIWLLNKDSENASEANIKYFIINTVASIIMLFGMICLFIATREINIPSIENSDNMLVFNYGSWLIIIALMTKMGVVPFHFLVPDLYLGINARTIGIISSVTKFSYIISMYYILHNFFDESSQDIRIMFIMIASLSMLFSAVVGVKKSNIKSLFAYSGIQNMSLVCLFLLVTNSPECLFVAVLYVFIYSIAIITSSYIIDKNCTDYSISSFADAKMSNKSKIAFVLSILSISGIPPMFGFFAKVLLIIYAIKYYALSSCNLSIALAILIPVVVSWVCSAYYYTRIMRNIAKSDIS